MADQVDLQENLKNIVKEGWLEKESKFIRSWRKRWFVLTNTTLFTFKEQKVYKNPTEVIPLQTVTTIKSADDETNKQNSFKLEIGHRKIYILTSSNNEKNRGLEQLVIKKFNLINLLRVFLKIGKQMIKLTQRKPSFDEDD